MTDRMALFCQCLGQHPGTANRPGRKGDSGSPRSAGSTSDSRAVRNSGIVGRQRFATAARARARATNPLGRLLQFHDDAFCANSRPRQTCGYGHHRTYRPQPSSKASAAAHTRRERSSNSGPSRIYIRSILSMVAASCMQHIMTFQVSVKLKRPICTGYLFTVPNRATNPRVKEWLSIIRMVEGRRSNLKRAINWPVIWVGKLRYTIVDALVQHLQIKRLVRSQHTTIELNPDLCPFAGRNAILLISEH